MNPLPTTPLPTFKYHPDPIATGVIEPSSTVCRACNLARGYIYTGPVYGDQEFNDHICPWCIADGTAHERLGADFTDDFGVGNGNGWESVDQSIVEEVVFRTPGFVSWQSEHWWTHCGDAAAFIGYAGFEELTGVWSEAVPVIRQEAHLGPDDDERWQTILRAFDQNARVVAYVFRCLNGGALGRYWECD
jgi:uncharacterized protein